MSSSVGPAGAFAATSEGLTVVLRVTPRAGRDALHGLISLDNGAIALKASVRAAPEDGAANEALTRLVAKSAGVAASRVRLERGAASRLKTVLIVGGDLAMADLLIAERLSKAD